MKTRHRSWSLCWPFIRDELLGFLALFVMFLVLIAVATDPNPSGWRVATALAVIFGCGFVVTCPHRRR